MKTRSYVAGIVVLAGALWIAANQQQRAWFVDTSKPALQKVGDSVQNSVQDLGVKVQHLTPNSSRTELEQGKDELTGNLEHARQKATGEYDLLRAQIDRIDAAERLQDAQQKLKQLETSAKELSKTGDEASKALADLKKKTDDAQSAYESAKTKVSQYLP